MQQDQKSYYERDNCGMDIFIHWTRIYILCFF